MVFFGILIGSYKLEFQSYVQKISPLFSMLIPVDWETGFCFSLSLLINWLYLSHNKTNYVKRGVQL